MKLQNTLALTLAGMLALSNLGLAATTATASAPSNSSSTSSTSDMLKKIRSKTKATYLMETFGPTTRTLSGNSDGSGTNIKINHYFGASYKIGSKWTVGATQMFRQNVDEKPATEVDPFVASDPYVTFTNGSVLKSERDGFNLLGQIRYYVPVSRASQQKIAKGTDTEAGYGTVRLGLVPSKKWLDGALNLEFFTFAYYRFNKNSTAERAALNSGNGNRQGFDIVIDPYLTYTVSKVVDVYLEYGAVIKHSSVADPEAGHWSSIRTEDYVALGSYITATPKLTINPYIANSLKGLRVYDLGLNLTYALL